MVYTLDSAMLREILQQRFVALKQYPYVFWMRPQEPLRLAKNRAAARRIASFVARIIAGSTFSTRSYESKPSASVSTSLVCVYMFAETPAGINDDTIGEVIFAYTWDIATALLPASITARTPYPCEQVQAGLALVQLVGLWCVGHRTIPAYRLLKELDRVRRTLN